MSISPQLNRMVVRPGLDRRNPGQSLLIRRPADEGGGLLPEDGAAVLATPYWMRRLAKRDVVLVTEEG